MPVARICAWRMKDWLRLVASMIVSKMPSFQRLLAWPISTRNCSVPSSAQACRSRKTALLEVGVPPPKSPSMRYFERAPAGQRAGVHADPAEARRHAEVAALHVGGAVVQRNGLRRRRIGLVAAVEIGPGRELGESVNAQLAVGAGNADGEARQIGPQCVLVLELVAHRLRRQQSGNVWIRRVMSWARSLPRPLRAGPGQRRPPAAREPGWRRPAARAWPLPPERHHCDAAGRPVVWSPADGFRVRPPDAAMRRSSASGPRWSAAAPVPDRPALQRPGHRQQDWSCARFPPRSA